MRAALLAASALLAGCAASVATAQSVTPPAETPRHPASWANDVVVIGQRASNAEPNATAATRTDTPIVDTPQSIAVLTRTLLTEQDRRSLSDALVNVAGVTPVRQEEVLFTAPIIRGFPSEIYLDGLPMYGATQTANDPTSLVGIERIDVIKGPVSTLYAGGVGTPLGGLINIESVRPTDRFGGYLAIRGGSFGTIDPYGDLNVPIAGGIAARVAGEYQHADSYIDRLTTTRWSVQPMVSFDLGPRTDLLIEGKVDHRDGLEYSGIPAQQALDRQIDRDAFPGAPLDQPHTFIDNALATATLRHRFSDRVRLTVSGRYYHSRSDEYGSFVLPQDPTISASPTAYPITSIFLTGLTREASVDTNIDVRTHALGGDHELLAGFNYDQTDFYSGLGYTGNPIGALDLARPNYGLRFDPDLPIVLTQTDRYETVAGYLQDQATYGPLHLTGSLRYTSLRFQEREQATDKTYHRVSPRVGATFDVVKGVAVYAAFATAFRGAFAIIPRPGETPKPETSRNVEAGVKIALPVPRVSGTIAVFDQSRRNVATADPTDVHYQIQTGEQRARGVEADLTWEPSPAFSVLATYAHTDAQVTETTADSGINLGDRLPRVPLDSGRVAARYRILTGAMKGLGIGAGVTASSSREITLPNSVTVPGYAAIDAQASYDIGRFTLGVSAVNLGGARTFDPYQYLFLPVVIPTQPRSAFVTLKIRI